MLNHRIWLIHTRTKTTASVLVHPRQVGHSFRFEKYVTIIWCLVFLSLFHALSLSLPLLLSLSSLSYLRVSLYRSCLLSVFHTSKILSTFMTFSVLSLSVFFIISVYFHASLLLNLFTIFEKCFVFNLTRKDWSMEKQLIYFKPDWLHIKCR